jgi:glycosyltransferase involved in cell wall biosynthesis
MKKITILLPNYNSGKYIAESVNSALQQTYENYDIHAYDNGSTDGSLEFLRETEIRNNNFTVHELPNIYKNSFREAVDHSFQNLDTDYITFLSADDFIEPNYLENCMKIISYDPKKIRCIQSHIIGVHEGKRRPPEGHHYKSIEEFKEMCMERSPVMSPTVVYNRDLYPLMNWSPHGGPAHRDSDLQEAGAGDYDTFCNFADNGVFIYPIPEFLGYYYRWHEDQCTWSVIEEKKKTNYDKIIQEYWKKRWTL